MQRRAQHLNRVTFNTFSQCVSGRYKELSVLKRIFSNILNYETMRMWDWVDCVTSNEPASWPRQNGTWQQQFQQQQSEICFKFRHTVSHTHWRLGWSLESDCHGLGVCNCFLMSRLLGWNVFIYKNPCKGKHVDGWNFLTESPYTHTHTHTHKHTRTHTHTSLLDYWISWVSNVWQFPGGKAGL